MTSYERPILADSNEPPFGGASLDLESQQPSTTAALGNTDSNRSLLQQSSHPVALVFHVLFRLIAVVLYILPNIVSADFVFMFVLSVLLLAFDFWTVKNVTGRLLVGLRWWNEVREDGTNVWIFESRDPSIPVNATDSRVFWGTLYATPVVWGLLALFTLIRFNFEWLLVVIVAIVLSGANLVGYMRCDKDAKQKWSGLADQAAGAGALGGLMSGMVMNGVRGMFTRS
ncbi:Golgi apparatus membrane protein tvp23 [Tieghemiomyces parasiticus]|uniref:Golgi apparatus membrane protein TVP23 n=1 Tax=Tieghemiomyces parasiticus TaxID=78921 RepID=A0A9W8DY04_9FUNG|nr:Golgi apparatus membrane protein tvp23 [Tieghemiomyces parasiticus]